MITGLCVLLVIGSVIFLLMRDKNTKAVELNSNEQKIANMYSQLYKVSLDKVIDLKAKYDSWKEVNEELMTEKYLISSDQKIKLYDTGYSVTDIEKAEELALKSGKNANDIIAVRGKGEDVLTWSEVIKKMDLNIEKNGGTEK